LGGLIKDPLAMKLLDFCTIPANMGGFPSLSINCGYSDGLPVGLLLTAPAMADEKLLQMGYSFESALPFAKGRPPVP
jgi:aspartyl-tRNA(Asn)/glutamyl-tRNA(Gln) amidotransferase subunit A